MARNTNCLTTCPPELADHVRAMVRARNLADVARVPRCSRYSVDRVCRGLVVLKSTEAKIAVAVARRTAQPVRQQSEKAGG